jgi:hypothetical protein
MNVTGQPHTPVALPSFIHCIDGSVDPDVLEKEISFASAGIRIPDRPARSLLHQLRSDVAQFG